MIVETTFEAFLTVGMVCFLLAFLQVKVNWAGENASWPAKIHQKSVDCKTEKAVPKKRQLLPVSLTYIHLLSTC